MELPKSYSGRDVGKYILPLIESSKKNLKIVSPYISPEHSMMLLEKAKEGINIEIITSDSDLEVHQESINLLKSQTNFSRNNIKIMQFWIFLLIITSIILMAFWAYPTMRIITFSIFVIIILFTSFRRRTNKKENIAVRIIPSNELVHAKIYIIDNSIGIIGSANLTKSGMERNFEHIEIKKDEDEVKKLIKTFYEI